MAYTDAPHIEAIFSAPGTSLPLTNLVNNYATVLVAAGWSPVTSIETTTDGDLYYRTIAPTILVVDQTNTFDSFSGFSSPPGSSCDGLSVWSIGGTSGANLDIGWDNPPGPYSEVMNCCVCAGNCSPGSKWGTGSGGTGTNSCGLNCTGPNLCGVTGTWSWGAGVSGQHGTLIDKIVEHMSDAAGCGTFKKEIIYTDTVGSNHLTSYVAVWCQGGPTNPLVGAINPILPGIGAAFNANVSAKHGGWVLQSVPLPTPENFTTIYIGQNRFQEGPGDVISSQYPFAQVFTSYVGGHPILYLDPLLQISGAGPRSIWRNEVNNARLMANGQQFWTYNYLSGTTTASGSSNELYSGSLRIVPLNGEDPETPASWDIRRAIYHVSGADLDTTGMHKSNSISSPNASEVLYYVVNAGSTYAGTSVVSSAQLGHVGYAWSTPTQNAIIEWISGESQMCEPWAGFNPVNGSAAPILGQIWDAVVPSRVGLGTGSGYFYWDGEWWKHWQEFRTDTASTGGPPANLALRVGYKDLSGPAPISGTWIGLPDPVDVFLYNGRVANLFEFPFAEVTGVALSTSTFNSGTTTSTLTATVSLVASDPGDHTKLVAIHSPKSYFTFTPGVISIASGTATGICEITCLSPGLGGITDIPIRISSVNTVEALVTVND